MKGKPFWQPARFSWIGLEKLNSHMAFFPQSQILFEFLTKKNTPQSLVHAGRMKPWYDTPQKPSVAVETPSGGWEKNYSVFCSFFNLRVNPPLPLPPYNSALDSTLKCCRCLILTETRELWRLIRRVQLCRAHGSQTPQKHIDKNAVFRK